MKCAAIGLGGNLGKVPCFFHSARRQLRAMGVMIDGVSSLYRTQALVAPNNLVSWVRVPAYWNAAFRVYTDKTPVQLLQLLQLIEHKHGRRRNGQLYQSRTLDLDLLLYENTTLNTANLVLPHPEIGRRAFVLQPLAEIWPCYQLPPDGSQIAELAKLPGANTGILSIQKLW